MLSNLGKESSVQTKSHSQRCEQQSCHRREPKIRWQSLHLEASWISEAARAGTQKSVLRNIKKESLAGCRGSRRRKALSRPVYAVLGTEPRTSKSKGSIVSRLSHLPRLKLDFLSLKDAEHEDSSRGQDTPGTCWQLQLWKGCRGRVE